MKDDVATLVLKQLRALRSDIAEIDRLGSPQERRSPDTPRAAASVVSVAAPRPRDLSGQSARA